MKIFSVCAPIREDRGIFLSYKPGLYYMLEYVIQARSGQTKIVMIVIHPNSGMSRITFSHGEIQRYLVP